MGASMQVGPFTAREHQIKMFDDSRQELGNLMSGGKKPYLLVVAPTGAGKTIYSSLIMSRMKEGKRTVFLVSGRQLVFQKSNKLSECQMPHSIMMADVNSELASRHDGKHFWERYAREYSQFDPPEFHQNIVVSKDTLESREITLKDLGADLIIVDEAHQSLSQKWLDIIDVGIPVIGLTGTPIDGKGRGLPFYEGMVVSSTFQELVKRGHLEDCRVKIPFTVELTRRGGEKVKIGNNNEYVQGELSEVFNDEKIIGDAIDAWEEHADGRPTLLYASGVEHSIALKDAFNQRGITAAHVDATTPQKERHDIYEKYQDGEIKVICNFGILLLGTDFPCTEVIQFLVSMNSLSRFLQACGRGSRPYTNEKTGYKKDGFLIIDHGGNVVGHDGYEKHGWPSEDREWPEKEDETVKRIDRTTNKPVVEEKKAAVCPSCKIEKGGQSRCPHCGYEYKKSGIMLRTPRAEFKEITPKQIKKKKEQSEPQKLWLSCLGIAANSGRTYAQANAIFRSKYGGPLPANVTPQCEIHQFRIRVAQLYPGFVRKKKAKV